MHAASRHGTPSLKSLPKDRCYMLASLLTLLKYELIENGHLWDRLLKKGVESGK